MTLSSAGASICCGYGQCAICVVTLSNSSRSENSLHILYEFVHAFKTAEQSDMRQFYNEKQHMSQQPWLKFIAL